MNPDEGREESEHHENRECDVLVLPCENPETIQETRNRVEEAYIFIDQFIFLLFSTEIIDEGNYCEYQQKSVYDAPDRESETYWSKWITIFFWQAFCCDTTKREDDREGIEGHHKYIGDDVEEWEFHSETMIVIKKGNAMDSFDSVIPAKWVYERDVESIPDTESFFVLFIEKVRKRFRGTQTRYRPGSSKYLFSSRSDSDSPKNLFLISAELWADFTLLQ